MLDHSQDDPFLPVFLKTVVVGPAGVSLSSADRRSLNGANQGAVSSVSLIFVMLVFPKMKLIGS